MTKNAQVKENNQVAMLLIFISVVCALLIQAPFTPLIIVTLSMLPISIIYWLRKRYRVALALVVINALGIIGVLRIGGG